MILDSTGEAAGLAPAFVPFVSEGFLLTLTNRGIYNRSLKDYESLGKVSFSVEGVNLRVDLGEAQVVLEGEIVKSRCSCPSRTICKHILMALFAARDLAAQCALPAVVVENAGVEAAGEEVLGNERGADFRELLEADMEALKKEAGKKVWEESLSLLSGGFGAAFTAGDMLEAELEAYGIRVYFPRRGSLAGAVCKCGESGLCKHKLLAILSYRREQGLFKTEEQENIPGELAEETISLLEEARTYLIALLDKGFISADETGIDGAQKLSLKFESSGIGNLSRLFRSLATDVENMLNKNAGFNHSRAFSTVSRLYLSSTLILKNRNHRENREALIEKSRSVYRIMARGSFTGLGAYPWQTRSGYTGVTCLVFHQETQTLLSYTASLAGFYESTKDAASLKSLTELYCRQVHWDASLSLRDISQGTFSLRNFKTNDEGRLSSSKETHFSPGGKTLLSDVSAAAAALSAGAREEAYDYFAPRGSRPRILVFSLGVSDCVYHKPLQILRFCLNQRDAEGVETVIPALIPYSEINLEAINYIEALGSGKSLDGGRWFLCEKEERGFIPLSAVTGAGVENFYFPAAQTAM